MPAKALLALDELAPPVATPVNPPDIEEIEKLPDKMQLQFVDAQKRIAAGDLTKGLKTLQHLADRAADNPRVLRALGAAYLKASDRSRALVSLRRAVMLAPDNLRAQLTLAELYAADKENSQAILALRAAGKCSDAVPAEPLAGRTIIQLGELLGKEGYWTAALQCYEKAIDWIDRYGPDYAADPKLREVVLRPERLMVPSGLMMMKLHRPADAAEILDKAYRRGRTNLPAAQHLAKALVAAGSHRRAEQLIVEMASEPAMRDHYPALAQSICTAAKDPDMPGRIWRSFLEKHHVDDRLGIALAQAAEKLHAPQQAAAILESVIEAMPNHIHATGTLALLHARAGKGEMAVRLLADAMVTSDSAPPTARQAIADVASAMNAETIGPLAAKIDKDTSPAKHSRHYVVGRLAQLNSLDALAAEQYRRSLSADETFLPTYEALVELYLTGKSYRQLDKLLEQIDRISGEGYFAYYIRGRIALARGRIKGAVKALQQANARNKRHVPTLLLLADAYAGARQPNDSMRAILAALNADPDAEAAYRKLFDQYLVRQRYKQAKAVAVKLLQRRRGSLAGHLMIGELYLATGKVEKAKKLLNKLKEHARDHPDVELFDIRVELGHPPAEPQDPAFDRAIDRLVGLIICHPRKTRPKRLLAEMVTKAQDRAIEVLARLYQQTDKQQDIGRAHVVALLRAKQHAQAADVLTELLANDPKDFWCQKTIVAVLVKLDRLNEAIQLGESWLAQVTANTDATWYRVTLLRLYASTKNYDKAHALLDEWLSSPVTEAESTALRTQKLQLFARAGRIDQAKSYGLSWLAESPAAGAPRQALVAVLADAGRLDGALELLDEWIRQARPTTQTTQATQATRPAQDDKITRWCHRAAVALLVTHGKYDRALRRAESYLAIKPADADMLHLQASCLSELGKNELAYSAMKKALSIRPDNPGFNNDLGYMYAEDGIRLAEAERLVRKALAARSEQPAFLDSLGWVFYKQGRFRESARIFERILNKTDEDVPSDSIMLDHAGDVYYRLGRVEKALELWTAAVEEAKKEKPYLAEFRRILAETPAKIDAVGRGEEPALAPLGRDVKK